MKIRFAAIISVFIVCPFIGIDHISAYTNQQIDSMYHSAYEQYRNHKLIDAVNICFEILPSAEKNNFEQAQVLCYSLLAECLSFQGAYQKSLEYVRKAEQFESYLAEEPYDHWMLKRIAYGSYFYIGLNSLVESEFQAAMKILMQEKDIHRRQLGLYTMYIEALAVHNPNKNPDTAYSYLSKAMAIMQDEDFKLQHKAYYDMDLGGLYINFGEYYNKDKQIPDSALHYFALAQELLPKDGDLLYNAFLYDGLSETYKIKNELEQAIAYALKALQIFEKSNTQNNVINSYSKLIDLYKLSNNPVEENEYLKLHKDLSDRMTQIKSQGRDETLINIFEQKENEIRKEKYKYVLVIIAVVVSLLTLILYSRYIYRREKHRKQQQLEESEARIKEKEKELSEAEEELKDSLLVITEKEQNLQQLSERINIQTQESSTLKERLNEAFDSLRKMAVENDPQFLPRFQEVYPHFATKLLAINSDLKNTELHLCAYIYMDFTTKEIAEYTFKSIKTIQNRKNSLRKRLNIESSIDLNVWIKSL